MLQPRPLPTRQKRIHQERLTHPITRMKLPPQHCTTPDRNERSDLPREWTVHKGTLRWTK